MFANKKIMCTFAGKLKIRSIEDIWPDYPTKEDFLFNEDEY